MLIKYGTNISQQHCIEQEEEIIGVIRRRHLHLPVHIHIRSMIPVCQHICQITTQCCIEQVEIIIRWIRSTCFHLIKRI